MEGSCFDNDNCILLYAKLWVVSFEVLLELR